MNFNTLLAIILALMLNAELKEYKDSVAGLRVQVDTLIMLHQSNLNGGSRVNNTEE